MNKEISLKDSKDLVSTIDFSKAWEQSISVISELVQIDEAADLIDIEITKEKANSFLMALDNLTIVKHYEEILPNLQHSFKRKEELDGLQGLLDSFNLAVKIGKKNVEYILKRMEEVYSDEEPDYDDDVGEAEKLRNKLETIALFQQIYSQALGNMNQATKGISKVIEVERKSGGRPWGNLNNNSNKTLQLPGSRKKDDESETPKINRVISAEELTEYET